MIELEYLSSSLKETIVYIKTHINYITMDINKFGKKLFELLRPIYNTMDIETFANAMNSLWKGLAGNLQDIEPFWTLSYADEPLSWVIRNRQESYLGKQLHTMTMKNNISIN